jgi:hypothetical protein
MGVHGIPAYSQQPTGKFVNIETVQKRMRITYDLIGSRETKYVVTLYLQRENDPNSLRRLLRVEGDVGDDMLAGSGLTITWDMSEIANPVEGARYQFALELRRADSGGIPWYLYAGAAVVGGVVYFAVRPAKEEKKIEDTGTIPLPPPR